MFRYTSGAFLFSLKAFVLRIINTCELELLNKFLPPDLDVG